MIADYYCDDFVFVSVSSLSLDSNEISSDHSEYWNLANHSKPMYFNNNNNKNNNNNNNNNNNTYI